MIRLIQINDQVFEFEGKHKIQNLDLMDILKLQGTNTLRVVGQGLILTEIKCFVHDPPNSRFETCPQCGTFKMKSNETINFLSDMQEQWPPFPPKRIQLKIIDQEQSIVFVGIGTLNKK